MTMNLLTNAKKLFQKKYPKASIIDQEREYLDQTSGDVIFKVSYLIVQDPESGVKQRVAVLDELGFRNEIQSIISNMDSIFSKLDQELSITFGTNLQRKSPAINTS